MVRPYETDDGKSLGEMLLAEGIKPDEMGFVDNETYVYEDDGIKGFYTYKIEHEVFPHLKHFCVTRDSRNGKIARELIKDFRQRLKAQGYRKAIVHAKDESLEKIIGWFFRVKPYREENGHKFFIAEV